MAAMTGSPTQTMPTFEYYRDAYGGTADRFLFYQTKPIAEWCVRKLCLSAAAAEDFVDEELRFAWCRAVCAAVETIEGTPSRRKGTVKASPVERVAKLIEAAAQAALAELNGTEIEPRL